MALDEVVSRVDHDRDTVRRQFGELVVSGEVESKTNGDYVVFWVFNSLDRRRVGKLDPNLSCYLPCTESGTGSRDPPVVIRSTQSLRRRQ